MTINFEEILNNFETTYQEVSDKKQPFTALIDYIDKLYSAIDSLHNKNDFEKYVDKLYQAIEKLNFLIKELAVNAIISESELSEPQKETLRLNFDYSYSDSCKQALSLVLKVCQEHLDTNRKEKYYQSYKQFHSKQIEIDKRLTELQFGSNDDEPNNK